MTAALQNDTFLRACLGEPTPYTPIWLMRQAGRYLPEYKALRSRAGSFMGLATNPRFATDVTLQPLGRFALDAAILFSDILTVPDAMGLGLSFAEGEGPRFERPIRDEAAVAQLAVPDMDRLRYVFDAVAEIRQGDPAHEIVSAAESARAGLVVLGTRGLTGLRRLLIGSVARNVLLSAPCSVLVVREGWVAGHFRADAGRETREVVSAFG